MRRPERHPDLLGIALVDDATVEALAHYFSTQPPPSAVAHDAKLIDEGSRIFSNGIEEKGVAACAVCHGNTPKVIGLYHGWPGSTRATSNVS